jgi:hypothetical protein
MSTRPEIIHPDFPDYRILYDFEYDMWIATLHDDMNKPALCFRDRTPLQAAAGLSRTLAGPVEVP